MNIHWIARQAAHGQCVRELIRRRGATLKGDSLWTKAEDDTLRGLYPDYDAARKILTRRTYHAIRSRASNLKLTMKKPQLFGYVGYPLSRNIWTASSAFARAVRIIG
jgi:hypothetical protein